MAGVFIVIGIVILVIVIVYFYKKKDAEDREKYNQFFESIKKIADEATTRILTKTDVLKMMEPYKPISLFDEEKKLVKLYGNDFLVFGAFYVGTSRSGWTQTTTSSEVRIAFYFSNDDLIEIKNVSHLLLS